MDKNKDKILKIVELATEISPLDMTQQTAGAPHVFIDYAPHVANMNVKVYLHGWAKDVRPDRIFDMSLGGFYDESGHFFGRRLSDSIDDAIDYLTDLLNSVKKNI